MKKHTWLKWVDLNNRAVGFKDRCLNRLATLQFVLIILYHLYSSLSIDTISCNLQFIILLPFTSCNIAVFCPSPFSLNHKEREIGIYFTPSYSTKMPLIPTAFFWHNSRYSFLFIGNQHLFCFLIYQFCKKSTISYIKNMPIRPFQIVRLCPIRPLFFPISSRISTISLTTNFLTHSHYFSPCISF